MSFQLIISEFAKCKLHEGNENYNIIYIEAEQGWDANNYMNMWHTQEVFQSEPALSRQASGEFIFNLFGFLIQA